MHHQLVLDRRGRHVLALAGLEQILHAPGDAQQALLVDRALVPCLEPTVIGEALFALLGLLVVAQHHGGVAHLNLTRFRVQAVLHALIGRAYRALLVLARFGEVGEREVLRHAVAFVDVQAQLAVPLQQCNGHGCCAPSGERALVQAQGLHHLLANDAANDRNAEQAIEFGGRHLVRNALLELDPEAGHREKDGGAGTLQVGGKGVEGLGEEHMHACAQPAVLDQHALDHVGQRQVGQHAVVGRHGDALEARVERPGEVLEAVHHALRAPGGARGVDQRGQLFALAQRCALQGLAAPADRVPAFVVFDRVQR
ncbi:hypothetical protein D9M69_475960 [compost metagenome]